MNCKLIDVIDENETIGNSLSTLNVNFKSLEIATCGLSSIVTEAVKNRSNNVSSLRGINKVVVNPNENVVIVSLAECPSWHVGISNVPLYQIPLPTRVSQATVLSSSFIDHLQFTVSVNCPLSGSERISTSFVVPNTGSKCMTYLATKNLLLVSENINAATVFSSVPLLTTSLLTPDIRFVNSSHLLPDGRVFLLKNGTQKTYNLPLTSTNFVGGYNISPQTNTIIPCGGADWQRLYPFNPRYYSHFGSALLPNGNVYINPSALGECSAIIYSPVTNSTELVSLTANGYSTSCVSLPDGRIYRIPGPASSRAHCYNPNTNRFELALGIITTTEAYPGVGGWHSGCLMADGRIFMAPNEPYRGALIFDPLAAEESLALTETLSGGYPTYSGDHDFFYNSSVLLPDGRILVLPWDPCVNQNAVIYNPYDNTNQVINIGASYTKGMLLEDGRVAIFGDNKLQFMSIYQQENFSFKALSGPHFNK